MTSARTAELQLLIDGVRRGDDAARAELINRSYSRLRALAAKLLRQDFPALRAPPALQNTSDVVQDATYRLYEALREVRPPTVLDFLRLAAQRMRWILLDLMKKHRPEREKRSPLPADDALAWPTRPAGDDVGETSQKLAILCEQVERLPPKLRDVIELLEFHGMTEAEAAEHLGVCTKTIRRRMAEVKVLVGGAVRQSRSASKEGGSHVPPRP